MGENGYDSGCLSDADLCEALALAVPGKTWPILRGPDVIARALPLEPVHGWTVASVWRRRKKRKVLTMENTLARALTIQNNDMRRFRRGHC